MRHKYRNLNQGDFMKRVLNEVNDLFPIINIKYVNKIQMVANYTLNNIMRL